MINSNVHRQSLDRLLLLLLEIVVDSYARRGKLIAGAELRPPKDMTACGDRLPGVGMRHAASISSCVMR